MKLFQRTLRKRNIYLYTSKRYSGRSSILTVFFRFVFAFPMLETLAESFQNSSAPYCNPGSIGYPFRRFFWQILSLDS